MTVEALINLRQLLSTFKTIDILLIPTKPALHNGSVLMNGESAKNGSVTVTVKWISQVSPAPADVTLPVIEESTSLTNKLLSVRIPFT